MNQLERKKLKSRNFGKTQRLRFIQDVEDLAFLTILKKYKSNKLMQSSGKRYQNIKEINFKLVTQKNDRLLNWLRKFIF